MKKIIGLSFCFIVFCCINMSAALIPRAGHATWKGTTAVALLPVTTDFDIDNNPLEIQDEFYKIYVADETVYKVEINYSQWVAYGSPSSFIIEYPNGQTTTIYIPDYSPTSQGSGTYVPRVRLSEYF